MVFSQALSNIPQHASHLMVGEAETSRDNGDPPSTGTKGVRIGGGLARRLGKYVHAARLSTTPSGAMSGMGRPRGDDASPTASEAKARRAATVTSRKAHKE